MDSYDDPLIFAARMNENTSTTALHDDIVKDNFIGDDEENSCVNRDSWEQSKLWSSYGPSNEQSSPSNTTSLLIDFEICKPPNWSCQNQVLYMLCFGSWQLSPLIEWFLYSHTSRSLGDLSNPTLPTIVML